jgi:hypothetical protein
MAKKSTFLGKTTPSRRKAEDFTPTPTVPTPWLLLLVGPLLVAFSILYFLFMDEKNPTIVVPNPVTQSETRSLGSISQKVAVTKDTTKPTTANPNSGTTIQSCKITVFKNATKNSDGSTPPKYLDAGKVFPIIPAELRGSTADCPSSQWNLDIVRYFAYKAITLANWLGIALTIMFTTYAGLLYITGFAKPGNVDTAKKILIATYSGLVILILARVILYGTMQTISGSSDPNKLPSESTNYIDLK